MHPSSRPLLLLASCLCAAPVHALVVAIQPGPRALYLQVGTGTMAGGTFLGRGAPQNNATINVVSVTVPAGALGTGAQPMTSSSAVANSPYDNRAFCSPPAEVYIGGFYRAPASASPSATLSVTTPANLTNATGATIPFSQITWTSSGLGDAAPTVPSGAFTGASLTLLSLGRNRWFESCLAFSYANTQLVPAGTFTGRATYTLVAP